jgi:hypothetical protein
MNRVRPIVPAASLQSVGHERRMRLTGAGMGVIVAVSLGWALYATTTAPTCVDPPARWESQHPVDVAP